MLRNLAPIVGLIAAAGCAGGKPLAVGADAPALGGKGKSIPSIDGKPVELEKLRKEGAVMLVLLRGFS